MGGRSWRSAGSRGTGGGGFAWGGACFLGGGGGRGAPPGCRASCVADRGAARARGLQAGDLMLGLDLIFGPSVERGPRDRKVYLPFDDGPNERATDAILAILAAERVPAAFFMVGDHVRRFPKMARRVADAGHEIGNHTEHHRKLFWLDRQTVRSELELAHEAITGIAGVTPRAFRAPHGHRSIFLVSTAREMSYTVYGWTFGVFDTALPGVDTLRRRVRKRQ